MEPEKRPSPELRTAIATTSRKLRRGYFIIAGVAALLVAGWLVRERLTAGRHTTDDAQIEADVVMLSARVGGPVAAVPVHDNQRVKKGDLLVVIDAAEPALRVRQAEGELDAAQAQADAADAQVAIARSSSSGGLSSARAQLSGSGAAVRTAGAQAQAAHAAVARARADLGKAGLDLERVKRLRAEDAVSATQLDDAQAAYDAARAALDQALAQEAAAGDQRRVAESRVAEAEGRVEQSGSVPAQIAAAEAAARLAHARVQTATAALEQARLQLSYTEVHAPAEGTVSQLAARVGQTLQPGQLIAALVPDAAYVVANFKETDVGEMRPGQPAEVEIDTYGGLTLHGVVDSLSGGTGARFSLLPPDNASGNFVKVVQRVPVKIVLTDAPKDLALRAGSSAEVTVHTR